MFDHKANSRADVQEFTATAYLVPMNFANSISNILLYFPCANHPDLNNFELAKSDLLISGLVGELSSKFIIIKIIFNTFF